MAWLLYAVDILAFCLRYALYSLNSYLNSHYDLEGELRCLLLGIANVSCRHQIAQLPCSGWWQVLLAHAPPSRHASDIDLMMRVTCMHSAHEVRR